MGRRKERRLAAISAAGRRVKLDLFAEPSGELSSTCTQDEAGRDSNYGTPAELHQSPSPSGKQLHNPLLLLEQYSDDELGENLGEGHDDAIAKGPSDSLTDETNVGGLMATDHVNDSSSHMVEMLEMNNGSATHDPLQKLGKENMLSNDTDNVLRETKPMEEGDACRASTCEQLVMEVSSIWKKEFHDESKQYYYWNTITGETSWEVPDHYAQATVLNDMEKDPNEDAVIKRLDEHPKSNFKIINNSNEEGEAVEIGEGCIGGSVVNIMGNTDYSRSSQPFVPRDALVADGRHSGDLNLEVDLSPQLVKHCETLLELLNSLKGLNCNLLWQEFRLKSMLEVEIRLSDIKALASHGSMMFPFWLHTEGQLKRLDSAVDNAIKRYGSTALLACETAVKSLADIKNISYEKAALCPGELQNHDKASVKLNTKAYSDVTTTGLVPSVVFPTMFSGDAAKGNNEIVGVEMQDKLVSKHVYHSGEEVDMDVDMDMDVEDTSSMKLSTEDASGACRDVLEESIFHDDLAGQEQCLTGQMFSDQLPTESWVLPSSLDNESCPPPPLDNESYPPPPPDEYPFPPPPPDEPPEDSNLPPSQMESVQSFPYSQQYIMSYPSSNLNFYGQLTTELSGSTLYTDPEGVQVVASHIPPYHEAVSNIYAVTPGVVNPGDPYSYYGLQDGNLNSISLLGGTAEPSFGLQNEAVVKNLDTYYTLLPKSDLNVVDSSQGSVKEPEVLDNQFSVKSQSVASTFHTVAASSVSNTTSSVPATSVSSKVQSKASRSKKQTVAVVSTLRANKKVSKLVDKWKAAKEELRDEEEPEDPCEMLERKRQREIEEWQAQQIVSGSAKENANFQPLGGDWQERVKRKRALKKKENEIKASENTENEGHNLVKLSRDLPSGWQAYWDDSSKQVYYGNLATSETTWIRPKE